ncbi:hypothetical protein GCM10011403_01960 [Pseudohongiella nitratireducens]|uniref:Flagellar protein n=1 Tax=Pseudohongiella nitratireducens TaxID=1768907 RepID=A0A917LP17_9GAMM|nr:flagellar biosynthetic protein FliO [Pseudohongiella nitratireducens]MDF1623603.1 flagellar biosynthetic protein FliO [Pseudohongiella nitratireducens]GGG48503.1 hypothetical protein GCM10011403_01960 [Pseudohongiella nitratireducens]
MSNVPLYISAMLLIGQASAQEISGSAASSQSPGVSSFLQMGMGLFVIVGLILFLAWVYRRVQPGAAGQVNAMNVLAAIPLGHRERLVMVKVIDRVLILGVTPQQINKLHEMSLEDVEAVISTDAGNGRFAEVLRQFTGRQS